MRVVRQIDGVRVRPGARCGVGMRDGFMVSPLRIREIVSRVAGCGPTSCCPRAHTKVRLAVCRMGVRTRAAACDRSGIVAAGRHVVRGQVGDCDGLGHRTCDQAHRAAVHQSDSTSRIRQVGGEAEQCCLCLLRRGQRVDTSEPSNGCSFEPRPSIQLRSTRH